MATYPNKRYIKLAKNIAEKYYTDKVNSIFLFGSSIRRNTNPNDIDIAIFYRGENILFKQLKDDKTLYDIIYYPLSYLDILYRENIRNTSNTWYKTSLWLNLLKNSLLLYSSDKNILLYRKTVYDWKWTSREIDLVYQNAIESLKIAKKMLEKEKLFESLISLRDSSYNYIIYKLMKKQFIPSPRPKDLYRLLKNNIPSFRDTFEYINGIDNVELNEIYYIIELFDKIWKTRHFRKRGAFSEYKNSLKILSRNDFGTALLNLRYSAFLILVELFGENKDITPYDTIQHLILYYKSRSLGELNFLYQILHIFNREIERKEIREKIEKMKKYIV